MSKELDGRTMRARARMKRFTHLQGAHKFGRQHYYMANCGVALAAFSIVFWFIRGLPAVPAGFAGLGLLLYALWDLLGRAVQELESVNYLIWDILTNKEVEEDSHWVYSIDDDTRARLRKLLGLDPDR